MGYRPEEFAAAFSKAAEKHPFINRATAELVLFNFEERTKANLAKKFSDREKYGLQIRYALNDSNIKEKPLRTAYASIIGFLYGKHGNSIAKKYRDQPDLRPPIPRYPNHTGAMSTILEKPNGQLAWEF